MHLYHKRADLPAFGCFEPKFRVPPPRPSHLHLPEVIKGMICSFSADSRRLKCRSLSATRQARISRSLSSEKEAGLACLLALACVVCSFSVSVGRSFAPFQIGALHHDKRPSPNLLFHLLIILIHGEPYWLDRFYTYKLL